MLLLPIPIEEGQSTTEGWGGYTQCDCCCNYLPPTILEEGREGEGERERKREGGRGRERERERERDQAITHTVMSSITAQ